MAQAVGGGGGHLHGPHDHRAFLQEAPVLRLPLGDDPVGNGAERLRVERPHCHGRVGQGEDPEYVTREPVGRETGWVMAGNSHQGGSRTGASTLWRSLPQRPRQLGMLLAYRLPAPRPLSGDTSGVIKPQAGPSGFLLPGSSSLPGASWVSLAGVVGAICAPVGQHPAVPWENRWMGIYRESWCLGVAVKGGGLVTRHNLGGRVWVGLRGASYLDVTWRRGLVQVP